MKKDIEHIPLIYDKRKHAREFVLKVTLLESPIEVNRRISVPSNIRLCHLGPVILRVMGWVGYHQEEFECGHTTYATKESVDYYEGWKTEDDDECYVDWAEVTLGDVLKKKGDTMTYVYDLGDDWRHEVRLVETHRYPAGSCPDSYVISGKNACPPDDAGGVYRYKELLDILANPEEDEEEYKSYKEWLPTGFDEHLFSVRDAELRMGDYLRAVRTAQQMMGDGYV